MNRRRAVVEALREGPVPPRELATRLGVPEADVGDHVDDLRDAGYGIRRDERGYRIMDTYGLGVADGLDAPLAVEYHGTVTSTNDVARDHAAAGRDRIAVLADTQTGGRGRRGDAWASPPGGIYCSLLLRPDLPADRVPLLTLAAGVAVVRAVEPLGVTASLKWPNDVLASRDRKLAGVLTEAASDAAGVAWVIAGVGVNANPGPGSLPPGAISLRDLVGDRIDRGPVTRRLVAAFHDLVGSPDRIRDAWLDRAATIGREVRATTPSGPVTGVAVDVDDDGALLVDDGDGPRRVTTADCEHLRAR